MTTVQPIKQVVLDNSIKLLQGRSVKKTASKPSHEVVTAAAAVAASVPLISTFLRDFNKTVDDNYFQFKTDEKTGFPYKPDKFQTTSAMHLYAGDDVLVTAPTGTGKTAIAEYIMTKNLSEGATTFYTTPLKALSNEKFLEFTRLYGEENVGLMTGDTKINIDAPIVVMTTEIYRNMVTSRKFKFDKDFDNGFNKSLKTVIFDELQYLGDIDRGGIWEQSIMFTPSNVQILSLSATIGNNETINDWIAFTKGRKGQIADVENPKLPEENRSKQTVLVNVPSENRHVPLNFEIERSAAEIKMPKTGSKKERIRAAQEGAVLSQSMYAKPSFNAYKYTIKKLNSLGKLPAIFFIFSKKECRKALNYLTEEGEILTTKDERSKIESTINRYKELGIYLGETLNTGALMNGYAIHNAGLLPSQKRLVEELFQKKLIKVVLATETLSAGINMPAKTTVISTPRKPSSTPDGGPDKKRNLMPNEFHQMAGRAGRRGIDTIGYCNLLCCNNTQAEYYNKLINSLSNPLSSNLDFDYSFITTYMSEFNDETEFRNLLSKSLYVYNGGNTVDNQKLETLINRYKTRRNILTENNYIDANGELTIKGRLIKELNGYEQIPIINMIDSKIFDTLNPMQIAGVIAGLANIRYYTGDDLPERKFELSQNDDPDFIYAVRTALSETREYEESSYRLYPRRELIIDSKTIDFAYYWADLNNRSYDSTENWKYLYSDKFRFSSKEEGAVFKELSMTVDLLKQLVNVAAKGEKYSEDIADKDYYYRLQNKFTEAIDLLQREPLNQDTI